MRTSYEGGGRVTEKETQNGLIETNATNEKGKKIMKKIFTLILTCIMMFALPMCQNAADSSEKTQTPETIAKEEVTMTKKSETMPEETTGGTKN